MLILKKNYKEPEKASKGVWIKYTDDFELLTGRMGSKRAKKVMRKLKSRHRNFDNLPPERQERLLLEAYCDCIFLGWRGKGLQDENGNSVPFTVDNVEALFEQEPKVFRFWLGEAEFDGNFTDQEEDDDDDYRDQEETEEGLSLIEKNS